MAKVWINQSWVPQKPDDKYDDGIAETTPLEWAMSRQQGEIEKTDYNSAGAHMGDNLCVRCKVNPCRMRFCEDCRRAARNEQSAAYTARKRAENKLPH